MLTKLKKYDNQPVLAPEQDMLKPLNFNLNTPSNIESGRQKKFEESLIKINQIYGRMLQRLAD